MIDLAATLDQVDLERAINEADKLDAVHVKQLHEAAKVSRSRGAARVKALIEKQTLLLTDSELERRFIPIAKRAGLSTPHSQAWVNGFRVDFYFDGEALIVEMDGGRFHRAGPAARGPDPRPRAYARRRDGAPVHPRTDHP